MTILCYRCQHECEPTGETESGWTVYVCPECGAENVDIGEADMAAVLNTEAIADTA